jgi:hypothetical protein
MAPQSATSAIAGMASWGAGLRLKEGAGTRPGTLSTKRPACIGLLAHEHYSAAHRADCSSDFGPILPANDFDPHRNYPIPDHAEPLCRGHREVDDAAADEGAAVIDHDYHPPPVLEVGYPHQSAEGQGAVCRRQPRAGVDRAACGLPSVEAGPVPGGQTGLAARPADRQYRACREGAEDQGKDEQQAWRAAKQRKLSHQTIGRRRSVSHALGG